MVASEPSGRERASAAYRQARIDVKIWTTFKLRWRCRTLKRQLGDLDEVGHSQLRAVVEELRARREAVPA